MSTLSNLMSRATAGIDASPSAATVDADVIRGRAVRRGRLTVRPAGTGVVAALVVAAAVGLPTTTGTAPAAAVPLVAYVGEQAPGFLLDTVPEDWQIIGSMPGELVLAGPDDEGAHPGSYRGRIVVNLVGPEVVPPDLDRAVTLRLDGQDVHVLPMDIPDGGYSVLVPRGTDGDHLYVQVPAEVHWSAQDVARFATGVTVTADAQMSVG